MIVFVSERLSCQLLEPENFSQFSVRIATTKDRFGELRKGLEGFLEFEDELTGWVYADALRTMSPPGKESYWRAELDRMIEKARPHGWIRELPELCIKAHVGWVELTAPRA